jgi:hypothetical protein
MGQQWKKDGRTMEERWENNEEQWRTDAKNNTSKEGQQFKGAVGRWLAAVSKK